MTHSIFIMRNFKHLFFADAIMDNVVMSSFGARSNKGIMYQPLYLAYLKILHLLEQTIVLRISTLFTLYLSSIKYYVNITSPKEYNGKCCSDSPLCKRKPAHVVSPLYAMQSSIASVAITTAVEDPTLGQGEDHHPELVIPIRRPIFRDI